MPTRASDEIFRILEALGESVWRRHLVTDEVTVTLGLWKSLGFTEDSVPRSIEEALGYFAPEDAVRVIRELEQFLAGDTAIYDTRARVRSAAGDWRWLRFTGAIVERSADERPLVVGGLMSDITEQVHKEEQRDSAAEAEPAVAARAADRQWRHFRKEQQGNRSRTQAQPPDRGILPRKADAQARSRRPCGPGPAGSQGRMDLVKR